MGSHVEATATGHGHASLGSTVQIKELYGQLVTPGSGVHIYGYSPVRRIYGAGWFGVGNAAASGYPDILLFGKFLAYEADDTIFTPYTGFNCSELWWDISPGTTLFIEVDW